MPSVSFNFLEKIYIYIYNNNDNKNKMKDTGSFNVAIPTLDSREAYSGPFYEEKQRAGVEGGYHVVPREDTFLDLVILNLA